MMRHPITLHHRKPCPQIAKTGGRLPGAASANASIDTGQIVPGAPPATAAIRSAAKPGRGKRSLGLGWPDTLNNLGAALQTLWARTRDPVPLDWAVTQFNLGTVEIAFFTLFAGPAQPDRAEAHVQAAREVFVKTRATNYIGMADAHLTQIAAKRPCA